MTSIDVLVIGAGLSGLKSAAVLIQNEKFRVTLVEAKNQIGGRVRTVRSNDNDFLYEAGAQFIHGIEDNQIKALTEQYSIKTIPFKSKCELFTDNGSKLDKSNEAFEILSSCSESFQNIIKNSSKQTDTNKNESVLSMLEQKWKNTNSKYQSIVNKFSKCLKNEETLEWGCGSLSEVSMNNYKLYKVCHGGDTLAVNGLDELVDKIGKVIPESCIKLNTEVISIDWFCGKPQDKVIVAFNDMTKSQTTTEEFDYVIVSISLGYLKVNHQRLFTPKLPTKKVTAIENLGFGNIAKVIFQYECIQEITDSTKLYLLQSESELGCFVVDVYSDYLNGKHSIVFWLSGDFAVKAEQLNEEKIKDLFTNELRKFVPNIPHPKSTYVTKWTSDPYTCGAYSFIAVDSGSKDIEALAEPLTINKNGEKIPKVLFAGEATHKHFFSTMHGAYESGEREAKRLVEICK